VDRRQFCLTSAAAALSGVAADMTGLAAVRPAPPVPPDASTPGVHLYRFLYDHRYSAGRVFGAAAGRERSVAGTAAIDGDITLLWSKDLRQQWSRGGGAIAGLTTARTLFCLEQLARDHWMRVLIRADHAVSPPDEIVHRLTAVEPMLAPMSSALAAEDWPARMPAALAAYAGRDGASRAHGANGANGANGAHGAQRVTRTMESPRGRDWIMADETLVSFVIA
jgi:hypothetical protein